MPSFHKDKLASRMDTTIRFFIYYLIFWLPYSIAVVETSVVISIILWLIKRCLMSSWRGWSRLTVKDKFLEIKRTFRPCPTFLDRPILYFLIICAISAAFSHLRVMSLHSLITKTLEWFIIYFLIIEVFKTEKQIWIAISIFLFTAFSTAIDSLVQFYITGRDIFLHGEISREGATAGFDYANGLAAYLTGVIPLISSLFWLKQKEKKEPLVFAILLVFVTWSMIVTFSRAAWLSVLIGICFFVFIIKPRIGFWVTVMIVTGVISLYVFLPYRFFERTRLDWNIISASADWRIGIWEDSLKMIKERPILGHGPNTFMPLFQNYRRMPPAPNIYGPTYEHNCYLQILVETGFLGIAGFFWILGKLFYEVGSAIKRATTIAPDLRCLLMGLSAGAIAFSTHSFFDTNLYSVQLSIYFWVLVAIMVSICRLIPSTKFSS